MRKWQLAGFILAAIFFAKTGHANWQGAGCWNCEYSGIVGTVDSQCSRAGDGQIGEGTDCNNYYDGWGWMCYTNNAACYNVDVDGGGEGGGGGGGSTNPCVIGPSAGCPAECSSCTRTLY